MKTFILLVLGVNALVVARLLWAWGAGVEAQDAASDHRLFLIRKAGL